MIIKGKSRSGPRTLAAHLGNAEKNERVQLIETRGTVARDLRGALVEMDAYSLATRCEKPLYHAALSPEPPHRLTPEQRIEAVDALEKKLGFDGHARVVVLHEKLGREHLHVVWSRIDLQNLKSVSDSHNYRKHEEVARDLERQFGHERVQGAHAERDGPNGRVARPDRTPSRAELRQEERTRIIGKQVKEQVSALFRASDGPEAFKAALEEHGYQLARGDRRDLVIVDQAGGIHSLARRIDAMKAADLREFMAPLDQSALPQVGDVRATLQLAWEASDEADLEKSYGRSGGYVSQSQAALRDHKRRRAESERQASGDSTWDKIELGERTRQAQTKEAGDAASVAPSETHDDKRPLTAAMQARLDRLLQSKADRLKGHDPTDRQNETPGGGHSRGR